MLKTENNIKLSSEAFKQIRAFIYEKSGIYFPDNKAYLIESRLATRVEEKGCKSFDEYISALKLNSFSESELTYIFNAVTINETSFFRDIDQLDVIHNNALMELVEEKKKKGEKRLRLWSAASSSGEEPYTIAMYLLEKQPQLAGWDIEVLGSDISEAVLSAARRGVYGSYSIKTTPEKYLRKYFSTNTDGTYSVKTEVKQLARFANMNLYDHQKLRSVKGMDIILCRNVLIYFDEESKRKVVSCLYDSLNPGGYLAVGRSESLHSISRAFRPVIKEKMVLYKKV